MDLHRSAQQARYPCLRALEPTLHKLEEDRVRSEQICSTPTLPQPRPKSRSTYVRPGRLYEKATDIDTSASKLIPAEDTDEKIVCWPGTPLSPCTSPVSSPRRPDRKVAPALLKKNMGLLKAAAIGDLAGLEAMLLQGADVNATYDAGLMSRTLESDKDIEASQLRRLSAEDPDYVFSIGEWTSMPLDASALILASRGGYVDLVKRLLAEPGIDCNKGTTEAHNFMRNGQTAMHWACRVGNFDVARTLLADEKVDVSTATEYGFVPFGLAVQQGHLAIVEMFLDSPRLDLRNKCTNADQIKLFEQMGVDIEEVNKCDCWGGLTVLLCAGGENRLDIVKRCMKDKRIRRFFFDPAVQELVPEMLRGCRVPIMFDHSPSMLALWLENGLNPNDRLADGATLLDDVVKRGMVEHVRVLLKHNAESTLLSAAQRSQLLGNAMHLKQLVLDGTVTAAGTEDSEQGRDMPALHRAALQGDDDKALAQVGSELTGLGSSAAACELLDEGKLPAAFYAVELGHLRVARELFERGHGLPKMLVDKLLEAACQCGNDAKQGQRSFRVCSALVQAGALEDATSRAGALAFVKPWCSSLVAATCLENIEHFKELSQLCQSKNDNFYKGVDERVTLTMLEKAAAIAADFPTDPVRQDDIGVVPPIKFYRDLSSRSTLCFDHEATVAKSYAYLGQGLEVVFETDVRKMYHDLPAAKVVTVAPKSFQRMQNKLLNPAEHGNPSMARPRCARNVDILRGCIIVQTVPELEAVFDKLKATYKVMRVKNTHDPSTDGYNGYRSLLVNFLYEPGLTWAELFGDNITFDVSDFNKFFEKKTTPIPANETHLGNLWVDFVEGNQLSPSIANLMAVQGLQTISKDHPKDPVRMIAELQLVLAPYFEGRAVSHLLFKVARCDTGAMEMVRDFYQEYFLKEGRQDEHLLAVRDIAVAVKEGRPPPKRVVCLKHAESQQAACTLVC